MKDKLISIVDSGFVMGLCLGILYFGGYIYFESLYNVLSIPYVLVDIPTERMFIYGAVPVFAWVISIGIIVAVYGYAKLSLPKIFSRIGKSSSDTYTADCYGEIVTGIMIIILGVISLNYISYASKMGHEKGLPDIAPILSG